MGMLRPQTFTQFFDIQLNTSSSSSYQKTGDLITLPYTEQSYVDQKVASRHINVNPYHVFAFIGNVKLTPETDIWNDTERLDVRINREGNFDAVLMELETHWELFGTQETTWVENLQLYQQKYNQLVRFMEWRPITGWNMSLEQKLQERLQKHLKYKQELVSQLVVEDFVETRTQNSICINYSIY